MLCCVFSFDRLDVVYAACDHRAVGSSRGCCAIIRDHDFATSIHNRPFAALGKNNSKLVIFCTIFE